MEISAHIDWLSITNKKTGMSVHPYLLDEPYEAVKARMGYTIARRFVQGVVEMQNVDRPDMGTHVIYSAQALRMLETELKTNLMTLLGFHVLREHNITRLDLAIDLRDSGLDIRSLFRQFEAGSCETRAKKCNLISGANGSGDTLYIGSMKKRTKLLRVYDKAKERKIEGDWKRIEIELKGKLATKAAKVIVENAEIGKSAIGMIKAFVDFPDDEVWSSVMGTNYIPITTVNKRSSNTEKWLLNQCAPALARAVLANSEFMDSFFEALEIKIERMKSGSLHD